VFPTKSVTFSGAAEHDERIVTIGAFVLFSRKSGDAWLLDAADHLGMPGSLRWRSRTRSHRGRRHDFHGRVEGAIPYRGWKARRRRSSVTQPKSSCGLVSSDGLEVCPYAVIGVVCGRKNKKFQMFLARFRTQPDGHRYDQPQLPPPWCRSWARGCSGAGATRRNHPRGSPLRSAR
jgi:hypothetical protein